MRVLFRSPEQWDNARAVLIESAKRLQDAGATALMIAANSMHKLAEDIGAGIAIPLIHIVDETGEKMRADGIKTAAVIVTRHVITARSEARRVGKECVSTCRFRCSPFLL